MPPVRDLQQLVNELGQAYAPATQLIDQSLSNQQQIAQDNAAAAEAQKQQEFRGIEQTAQNRGMYFSGFTPNEQAQYVSANYLPALAKFRTDLEEARLAALGKKADIQTSVFNQALGIRESDLAAQRQYQTEQERRAYEAEQARIQREFQSREAARDRSLSAVAATTKVKEPTKADARQGLTSDVAMFFNNLGGSQALTDPRNEFITERQLIPRLLQAYPELTPEEVNDVVYSYRKNAFGV